jgi:hypothetical protein
MENDELPKTEMPSGDPAPAEPESIPLTGAEPESIPPAAESESSPPAPDAQAPPAAASPATEGPPDLDKMEAQIRHRLGELMHRAKAVQTRAEHLLGRVEPMVRTRKKLERVAEAGNTRIQAIREPAREESSLRASAIREITVGMTYEVDLRHEMFAAQLNAWQEFQAIIQVPAEAWFAVVAARQSDAVARLSGLQQWLETAEKRWGGVTAAAPEPKARPAAARTAKSPRPDKRQGRPSP